MPCIVLRRLAARSLLLLAAALLIPTLAQSQAIAPVLASPSAALAESVPSASGPRAMQAGVTRAHLESSSLAQISLAPDPGPASRRDVAWMVVGGAGLVVGSIVGGDAGTIIMVSGGVIGLVGLFRWLR